MFSELAKGLEMQGNNTQHLISHTGDVDQPNYEPKIDQGHCVGKFLGLDVPREQIDGRSYPSFWMKPVTKTASSSQYADSYTWSQTDLAQSQIEHALETKLLKLLRVGLFPAQEVKPDWESNQNHTYYNLDDLKGILHNRKEYWTPEPSQTGEIFATPPVNDLQRDSTTAVHKSRESLRIEDPIDSKNQNTQESLPDKTFPPQILSKLVSQSHDNKTVSSISQQKRLKQVKMNINDTRNFQESPPDDAFFANLDAAFWAIVEPKTQNEMDSLVMMGIRQSSPTFDFEDIMTIAELNSADILRWPSQGVLSHVQVGVETLYPIPPAAHGHFNLKNHVTDLHDQRDIFLPQSPQKEVSNHKAMQRPRLNPSITHYSNDDSIPPGFWRQNRLY